MSSTIKEANIQDLFYEDKNGNKKRFGSLLVNVARAAYANKNFENADELLEALGGAEAIPKSEHIVTFSLDAKYKHNMVCKTCNHTTENKPGYECKVSSNSKNITYSIKTSCAVCNTIKNHYVSKSSLPNDLISKIDAKIKKDKKK